MASTSQETPRPEIHIFALHCLVECSKKSNTPLFCAFLDLSSAYDKVWRDAMFMKMAQSGIGGNFLNIVKSMYAVTKSYIRVIS